MPQNWSRILRAFIIWGVLTVPLFAQTEWYLNKPIYEIEFEGLTRVSQNELDGITAEYIGKPFTESIFQDLQRRLYALDYFEYLIADSRDPLGDQSQVTIVFEVLERPVVGSIKFEGLRRIRESQLKEEILLKIGDVYSVPKIRADQEALRKFYLEKGYPQAEVGYSVSDLSNGDKEVLFSVSEGPQTTIRTIGFEGISFGTASSLKAELTSKEQGIFNSGVFQETSLEADREAIVNYYHENGFVDAQVVDTRTEFLPNEDGTQSSVVLTFVVSEGSRWTFGGLSYTGNEIFSDEVLNRNLDLTEGEVLDLVTLRTNLQEIVDVYFQNGYFNNQIDFKEERDEQLLSIRYEIIIVEQPRSYIENIVVRGNDKTKDNVILRELPFETGEVFSAAKIREGLLNIYNLQFFEGVPVIETPQGSQSELRDVIITVEERRTLDVRGGFSIGGEGFPLALIGSVSDINFLGNGQNLGVQLNLSSQTQSLSANFTDNYLFGDRIGGGINLTLEHSQKRNEPQDILGPIFFGDEQNAVPDPFLGEYVVTKSGGGYDEGDVFNGDPSASDIETYGLVTDYEYAGGSAAIPDSYLMNYEVYNISLGFNASIRRRTALGWAGAGASISSALNFIDYDESLYRAYSPALRENLNTVKLINRLGVNASLDNRDVYFNPSSGYYFSQAFSFTGGFLFGSRHYIRSDTTAQGFLTLAHAGDEPIGNWRLVLALNSTLSVLLPQIWTAENQEDDNFVPGESLLFTNGMSVARGWPTASQGEALWNNWLELRMPIVESVVWFDVYAEAVRLVRERENMFQFAQNPEAWMFGFGAGLRLVIPQLPIRIYVAKRLGLDSDGQIVPQTGNLFANGEEGAGLDLIFAISLF